MSGDIVDQITNIKKSIEDGTIGGVRLEESVSTRYKTMLGQMKTMLSTSGDVANMNLTDFRPGLPSAPYDAAADALANALSAAGREFKDRHGNLVKYVDQFLAAISAAEQKFKDLDGG